MKTVSALIEGLFLSAVLAGSNQAGELSVPKGPLPAKIAAASTEAETAIRLFQPTPGFKVELFAAEPHLANPVSFCIDEKGRFYVVETFRLHDGVTDIRGHMDWLDEDLASRTVDDRLAMMKRHLGAKFDDTARQSDRIALVEDTNGDGKADRSTVFAEGFNSPLDGIAAGVLARKGQVWFANLPHLWSLKDKNGDGQADERISLSYGYGLRVGFLGHDLHGLRFGPDGKLYFSLGDRGSNIQTGGRTVGDVDAGSVFRCNPDGTELEVFASGLRNPQGLAFDDFGNLFTGDNNSDGGDRARWVYLVEGGDSGWRAGYQFLGFPNSRGPWNSEKMWHPRWEGQAAFIVPPLLNLGDGPSGIAYYPGTGMPERYAGHFFMTDFKGGKGSGIHSFGLKAAGASFELVDQHKFLWECLPTDVNFGVDGGLYYTDWVQGWNMTGKGRLYHVFEPAAAQQKIVAETRKLLGDGMEGRTPRELSQLLGHADMRVRQEAQFELADRGYKSIAVLGQTAYKSKSLLARVHAIWAIGQIAHRSNPYAAGPEGNPAADNLLDLLKDGEPEVRAQAAKVLGDQRSAKAGPGLITLLSDPSSRVQFFAAIALGKIKTHSAVAPLVALLRANQDKDAYVRHAAVMGLLGTAQLEDLLQAAQDESEAVRMGALLVMRRLGMAEVARFLSDKNPLLVTEAARAINDLPISGAIPDLAKLSTRRDLPEPALRRAVNANFRFGLKENAEALARFAGDDQYPETLRREALMDLGDWPKPSGRDRVTGLWRPTAGARDVATPAQALAAVYKGILSKGPRVVQLAGLRAVQSLQLEEAIPTVAQLYGTGESASVKVEALKTLAALNAPELGRYIQEGQADASGEVRREALRLQARVRPAGAVAPLAAALENGSITDKQSALATLGSLNDPGAEPLILAALEKISALPREIQLDVLEAASKKTNAALKAKLKGYEEGLPKTDELAAFRVSLHGGSAEEGKKIFFERAEAACVRCHKIAGEGGEVGPDLSQVGSRKDRTYILESVLLPNKEIAAGFESLIVKTKAGTSYAGTVKTETPQHLVLNSPEDGIVTIAKAEIIGRERGLSAMPEGMSNILSRQDLRNLVEYLANLK